MKKGVGISLLLILAGAATALAEDSVPIYTRDRQPAPINGRVTQEGQVTGHRGGAFYHGTMDKSGSIMLHDNKGGFYTGQKEGGGAWLTPTRPSKDQD